jgi:hypothetical protein
VAESVFQPEWSPDGYEVIFVSDRTGWWNLYACKVATGTTRSLCPMQAEFGMFAQAEPQVWSTEVKPILTPSRLGSAAIVSIVCEEALNKRS